MSRYGEISELKKAQDEALAMQNGAERVNYVSDVPCDGCTICCHHDVITLTEAEAVFLPSEPNPIRPEKRMLAHKENGDCIYLTEAGCGNYLNRPQICRACDCRRVARRFTYKQAVRLNVVPAWQKGMELLTKAKG